MKQRLRTVLITGAARGIGYHLAWFFLDTGHQVIMVDIDATGLFQAVSRLEKHFKKERIKVICADVTRPCNIQTIKDVLEYENYEVDILINNAGIGQHSTLIDTDSERLSELMNVNFFSAEALIKAVVPQMIKRGSGQIVNVCSGQVFFNIPTWAAYTCTKAALSAYSEALYHELKPKGIAVTTVYPFMVNTGFYNDVQGETWGGKLSMILLPFYSMDPEKVAKIIFQATLKEKRREMVSLLNYAGKFINAVGPLSNIVGRISNFLLAKK
ncbi:SDR family NAD(P)-dependent oxidoreductase [Candidatus Bathyarchaeota archaeon]|nr:SDR family NAD(P)-dependent oxidoreductase [Candidatus Bathyarchaeota archaeon]